MRLLHGSSSGSNLYLVLLLNAVDTLSNALSSYQVPFVVFIVKSGGGIVSFISFISAYMTVIRSILNQELFRFGLIFLHALRQPLFTSQIGSCMLIR